VNEADIDGFIGIESDVDLQSIVVLAAIVRLPLHFYS
jgi:hypothetical protein